MSTEIPEPVQRWTAKRRSALVLTILTGETSAQEAARQHGLTVAEVEDRSRWLSPLVTDESSSDSLGWYRGRKAPGQKPVDHYGAG